MNYVKRKGTKAARKLPADFENIKEAFLSRITQSIQKYNIPKELCINMDETGARFVPVSDWTMAEQGSAQVPVTGYDVRDK